MSARLYLAPARLRQGTIVVEGADFHYLARVLRLRVGDALTVFDGQGRAAAATVAGAGAASLELRLAAPEASAGSAAPAVTLLLALLKGEKMDLVVQKATELGVARLVPVRAARSVVRLDEDRAGTRTARWQKIALEAARQSGRADAPVIEPLADLGEALAAAPPFAWRVLLHEAERGHGLREALPAARPPEVVFAVGPEGGFDDVELAAARAAGFAVVGLGPRILRAETAALAGLAVLGFALGDLGS